MASVRAAGRTIWNQRKRIVLVLTPVILSPLLIKVQTAAASCAYAVLIISIYWMAEVFPMAVTALLPVLLFPLLGIMHSSRVSANYMKDIIMTMIGAFFVADALAYWDLHRRFALKILLYTASSPRWLMFGLMATTSFLAMWMSNSVVTAMMVPLTIAILKEIDTKRKETKHSGMENGAVIVERTEEGIEIKEYNSVHDYDKSTEEVEALRKSRDSDPTGDEAFTRLSKGMVLCVAYAANIGGTATLYGTSSNIVMTGQLESLYGYEAVIDFGTWFLYAFPNQLIILLFAWFVLQWRFLDLRGILKNCRCGFSTCCSKTTKKESDAQLVIREQYEAMGSMSWAEVVVLIHFVVLSLLWLSYSPRFIPGWASIFDHGYVTATTATIAVVVSLCLFPAKRPAFLKCGNGSATHIIQDDENSSSSETLLDWRRASSNLKWEVIFLMGAGYAIADAFQVSGLSDYLAEKFAVFANIPPWTLVLVCTVLIAVLTEFISNTATAAVFLPIIAKMAESVDINPHYLMIPTTVASSFAFMLPIATPPNAIAFSYGTLNVLDMAKSGFLMNLASIVIVNLTINTLGVLIFDLHTYPDWAGGSPTSSPMLTTCIYYNVTGIDPSATVTVQ